MPRQKPLHVRVREHVEAEGWTPMDLAKRVGWHRLRAQRVLSGATKLLATDMEAIAAALNKPVGEIFESPRKANGKGGGR